MFAIRWPRGSLSFRKPLRLGPDANFMEMGSASNTRMAAKPLSRQDAEGKILVAVDEPEVVLVIGQECRPDPPRAERDQNIVEQGGELGSPTPFFLFKGRYDRSRFYPVIESGVHYPPGTLHRTDKFGQQITGAAIPGINVELVRYNGRQIGGGQQRKKGLSKSISFRLRPGGSEVDISIEQVLHR